MRQPVPFGKYLLLDRISVGGMAEVFKAKSYGVEGFEKIIAIKRILPTMGEDRDFIKMFIDEAKIAGQLAHANICQIFELGRIDGSHFIAMEYIWGKDLLQIQNRLRKLKQGMPVPMACFVIAKVLEGLDYAHRKRDPLGRPLEIVHRDCSPQNVLVSYEGEVKVIDFGIAKATSRNSRTMAGVLKGKFGYMSPEQVRGLPLDRRSDIFALGTMLFECLTGERLFQGETDFSTLEKVRNVDIRRPREVNPNIPESIERVILKALAKDVDERYQWCNEMHADLQHYLMGNDVVFTPKSLSAWLKEAFAQDLDKERGLLEQYKRVGRDGLIAGMPAAEAKLDVVEHLGEAPQIAEADATQLGGPSFDDLEKELAAMAAGAEAGEAPRGRARTQADDSQDFGEEAPTEIFGEEHGPKPGVVATPMAASKSQPVRAPSGRVPTASPRAQTAAPIAPAPGPQPMARAASTPSPMVPTASAQQPTMMSMPAPSQADIQAAAAQYAQVNQMHALSHVQAVQAPSSLSPAPQFVQPLPAMPTPPPMPMPQPPPGPNPPGGGFASFGAEYSMASPLPTGTPGPHTPAGPGGKTVMGVQAPPGVPNYSRGGSISQLQPTQPQPPNAFDPMTGRPLNPSGQVPAYPSAQPYYGQQGSPYPVADPNAYGGYPQQGGLAPQTTPQPHAYPASGPMSPYDQSQPFAAVAPVTGVQKKRSTLGRDIGIGVAIALVVLGIFLVVKFVVLGKSEPAAASAGSGSASPAIATLRISLPNVPAGTTAQLFIDGKAIGPYGDKAEVLTNAGTRTVKLVKDDSNCERELKLDAGKPNVFDCILTLKAAPAPVGSGAGSAAVATVGSGSGSGSGSATAVAADGSGSGSNSAQVAVKDPVKVDPPKVDPPKVDPPKVDPPKVDPPKVDPKKQPDPVKKDPVVVKQPDPVKKDPKPDVKPASDKGFLEVYSTPKAKVLVDGVDTGMSTPITGKALSLTPGKHKITFLVGEDKFTYQAIVKAGQVETMRKEL